MKLALAWVIVGVPAGWGVKQTFEQSLKLFRAPVGPSAAGATPAAVR